MAADRVQRVAASRLFFPAAAVHAALLLPLSVTGMLGRLSPMPLAVARELHAGEMLFGFATAVIAGFLIQSTIRRQLALLFVAWLAGRASVLLLSAPWMVAFSNGLFVALLLYHTVPMFAGAAKKWRNRSVVLILAGIGLAAMLYHLPGVAGRISISQSLLPTAVLLLALLMIYMGGRMIPAAYAGHIRRKGGYLAARVQPRLEAWLIAVMGIAILLQAAGADQRLSGVVVLVAAVLTGVRLLRWQPWLCRDRADLFCLGIGYSWLAVGLLLTGLSLVTGLIATTTALHALTVGALGTLTSTVMARNWWIKRRRNPEQIRGLPVIVLSISAAALIRLTLPAGSAGGMLVAALLWSAAYAGLLWVFLQAGRVMAAR
ncbi:MAG: NnrS family protein [Pseudohongiellaceae bacterium]